MRTWLNYSILLVVCSLLQPSQPSVCSYTLGFESIMISSLF
jgi:hypothetical protein